jgi:phosphate transport system permease protein
VMLPVVIGSTEQMLRLVPQQLREASYALGASKSRTILTVVLPAALPGIVSGALLAVARAAGETAPLMFAIGAAKAYNPHLFEQANTTLSMQVYSIAANDLAFPAAEARAWGAAFTLVAITFLMTLAARIFTSRFALKR